MAQGGKGIKLAPRRTPDATAGQTRDRMEDFSRLKPVGRRSRAAQMAPENPLGKMLQASSRQKGPQGPFHDPASQSAPKRRRRYHIERIIRRRIARRYIVLCRIMRWRIIFRCIMRWRIM